MSFLRILACLGVLLPGFVAAKDTTVYCAPNGRDTHSHGTHAKPFHTVTYALDHIGPAGGATCILGDGDYDRPRSSWSFEAPVVIQAAHPRAARLERLYLRNCRNVVWDGVRVDRQSSDEAANVVQFDGSSYCTLRNCIITHGTGGYQNTDAVKINNGSHHVLLENNVIFDGTDEEVDILQDVHDIVLRGNTLYQAGVHKPEAMVSNKMRARRVVFDRNLFANLNRESGNGALRFGGGRGSGAEADTLIAMENLFINTTGRGALTMVGARDCLVYGNVFVNHDDRRTGPVAIYANYPRSGITNDGLFILHNIFFDAHGRWTRPVYAFQDTLPEKRHISHNLYWNGGKPVPSDKLHDPQGEPGSCFNDPRFSGDVAALSSTPDDSWRETLRLHADSPFHRNDIDPATADLPAELRQFLLDYLGEGEDPWYHEIRRDFAP